MGLGEPGGPPIFHLPELCCAAAGGSPVAAGVIQQAWQMLYAAAHLLDNVEDGDPLPLAITSPGQAVRAATGLIFAAENRLANLEGTGLSPRAAGDLRRVFNATIERMCLGQELGEHPSTGDLDALWQAADLKSGIFFALGCYAGARAAIGSPKRLASFWEFGCCLGRLIQVGDDLKDLWPDASGRSDLTDGRPGLPIAYALQVLPGAGRDELHSYIAASRYDPAAEEAARAIVLKAGGGLYLALETERLRMEGLRHLNRACAPGPARESLAAILRQAGGSL